MPQNIIAMLTAANTAITQVTLHFDMATPSLSLGGNYIEFIGKTMIIDEAYLR